MRAASIRQFLARYAIIAASVPFIIGLGLQAAHKTPSEWLDPLVRAGRVFFAGGDIYALGSYLYPPFMALAVVPFIALSDLASRLAWFAMNVVCIAGLVRSAWLLSGGLALQPIGATTRREWVIAGVGIVCCASYFFNALAHQQIDLMIDFLVVAGCLLLVRGQGSWGAVLIGLAAACKGPPLLFAGYLFFRRNWAAAFLLIVVAIGVNLLPDLIVPPPDGKLRLAAWLERHVIPTFSGEIGGWNGITVFNQSLAGTLKRLSTTVLQWTPNELSVVVGARQVADPLIKLAVYGSMLALLAVSIVASLRGQAIARISPAGSRLPSQTALELSAMSALVLLMSPMSDLAHLGVLILPAFCLTRIAVLSRDRTIAAMLVVAAVGAVGVNKDLTGDTGYTFALWIGIATLSTLALWAGCVIAVARGNASPPAADFAGSIFAFIERRSIAPT